MASHMRTELIIAARDHDRLASTGVVFHSDRGAQLNPPSAPSRLSPLTADASNAGDAEGGAVRWSPSPMLGAPKDDRSGASGRDNGGLQRTTKDLMSGSTILSAATDTSLSRTRDPRGAIGRRAHWA